MSLFNSTMILRYAMVGKQAKILSDEQVESLLLFVSTSRHPIRNRVLVLLSLKAGLRAGEIANLTWPMVLGPQSEIGLCNRTVGPRREETKRTAYSYAPRSARCPKPLARRYGYHRAGCPIRTRADQCLQSASSTGLARRIGTLVSQGARPIRAAGPSSPGQRGSCITQAGPCATCNCWQGIDRSKRPSDISTATRMLNASSSR